MSYPLPMDEQTDPNRKKASPLKSVNIKECFTIPITT